MWRTGPLLGPNDENLGAENEAFWGPLLGPNDENLGVENEAFWGQML